MPPFSLTDGSQQPMGAWNQPESDRKHTELPRRWFIRGQAETFGRHFVAELLSGVWQVVQTAAQKKIGLR